MKSEFANLRDVSAGLPSGSIRPGVLLRSDAPLPGDAAPADVAWPPSTVIDLRHEIELKDEHPLGAVAIVHNVSLVDPSQGARTTPQEGDELTDFYGSLLQGSSVDGLIQAVDIVGSADGPVLIHCLAGKDRTGVTVALLLSLVGIESDAVIGEYLLTNLAADALLERLRFHYRQLEHRKDAADGLTFENIAARETLIAAALTRWHEWPGGPVGWFFDYGGTEDSLRGLRERLLV
jgi:hypothetical protein